MESPMSQASGSKTANRQPLTVRLDPESKKLFAEAQHDAEMRFRMYDYLASFKAQSPA